MNDNEYSKSDKCQAQGFLKLWEKGGKNMSLTLGIRDILQILMVLQKVSQKDKLILTQVAEAKTKAIK